MSFGWGPLGLAVVVVALLASVELSKTLRWRSLLGQTPPAVSRCLRALVAGQLTNALAPVRGGEAVSVGLLRIEGGPLMGGAAALVATKALDALCLAGIAAAVVGAAALQRRWLVVAALLVAAGAGAVLLRRPLTGWAQKTWLWRKLHLEELAGVARGLGQPRTVAILVTTTATVWLAGMLANWLVLLAVGVPPSVDAAARVLVAGYIAGLLPAPPARIGVFEGSIVAALSSVGVGLPQAAAAAVTLHACQLAELGLLLAISLVWSKSGRSRPAAASLSLD